MLQSTPYEKEITVQEAHLDALKHVNNVVFLQWIQDIAGEHWDSKSNAQFDAQYYWVVLDHFIEYKRQAVLHDSLLVRTFVEKNEGVRSWRIVEFYKNEKLVVRSKTTWCLISREKNRPVRIPKEVDAMFFQAFGTA